MGAESSRGTGPGPVGSRETSPAARVSWPVSASRSPTPPRYGTAPVAVLTTLLVVALTVWWVQRSATERAREDRLESWAGAPLPAPADPVDSALAAVGAQLFREKCSACHVIYGEGHVGPDLAGVTHRRTPGWIQSMILAPDSMIRVDPAARSLKVRYGVQMMVPGGMDTLEARAVLEFLRRVDGPPPGG